jgi:pimeloyl-ACP methyl ester carboxylesterase
MNAVFRWSGKLLKWLLIGMVGLTVLGVVAANVYGLYGRYQLDKDYPAPGRMISIGTHRMHMHCVGEGKPTVVLDAGGAGFSVMWAAVIERAQSVTRLCAFDRSGLGWSEPGKVSPTAESREADLEALLAVSGESPPFILVGHSLGGMHAWLYAQDHLDQAAGLIAVDTAPPNMADLNAMGPGVKIEGGQRLLFMSIERLGLVPALVGDLPVETEGLPESASVVMKRSRFLSKGLLSEQLAMDALAHAARKMGSIQDLPLIVITHGMPGDFEAWGFGDRAQDAEQAWQDMQVELSELSSNGEIFIAQESGHMVPVQQPAIVVDAIRRLVEGYRARQQ